MASETYPAAHGGKPGAVEALLRAWRAGKIAQAPIDVPTTEASGRPSRTPGSLRPKTPVSLPCVLASQRPLDLVSLVQDSAAALDAGLYNQLPLRLYFVDRPPQQGAVIPQQNCPAEGF